MIKNKWKISIIVACVVLLIAFVSGMFIYKTRYKYWHLYVHKSIHFFLDDEFKSLIKKFPDKEGLASHESLDGFGIIVTYPQMISDKYAIQLVLTKHFNSEVFEFKAEIASPKPKRHSDTGSPEIYMLIPMKYFPTIIDYGITDEHINQLINAAGQSGWVPLEGIDEDAEYKSPIVIKYVSKSDK